MRIQATPLKAIRPHPENPKGHDLDLIETSIRRFGFVNPLVVCERSGYLAVGHGRLEALQAMQGASQEPPEGITVRGKDWLVPVVQGWSSKDDAELLAYVVADNRSTELGGWHDDTLAAVLAKVAQTEEGLAGTGYDDRELVQFLARIDQREEGLTDPDSVPETAPAKTKLGDLWWLGDHRLLCGDATIRQDFDRVLEGENLTGSVVTDPPYGVGIGAKNRALDSIDRAGRVLTDLEGDQGIEEVEKLWRASFTVLADVMAPGSPYYIFGPQGGDLGLLLLLLRDSGLAPRHILIWAKNRPSFSIGRLDYDYQHEPIVYGWRPGAAHPWYAGDTRSSILTFDRPQASRLHPTMKPVDLLSHLITNSTPAGGFVLDPFGGSGSTLIACQQTGRIARLMEIDPHYCDVICKRYQDFTGDTPILERTGKPVSFVDG